MMTRFKFIQHSFLFRLSECSSNAYILMKKVLFVYLGAFLLESIPDDSEVRSDKLDDHFQAKNMV